MMSDGHVHPAQRVYIRTLGRAEPLSPPQHSPLTKTTQPTLPSITKNGQDTQDSNGSHFCRNDSDREAGGVLLARGSARLCLYSYSVYPGVDVRFTTI